MQPSERLNKSKTKGLRFQCLTSGFKKGHDGFCYNKFSCPDPSHNKFDTGYHVLVCDKHKTNIKNQEMLKDYKLKYINNPDSKHKQFSKNLPILCCIELLR